MHECVAVQSTAIRLSEWMPGGPEYRHRTEWVNAWRFRVPPYDRVSECMAVQSTAIRQTETTSNKLCKPRVHKTYVRKIINHLHYIFYFSSQSLSLSVSKRTLIVVATPTSMYQTQAIKVSVLSKNHNDDKKVNLNEEHRLQRGRWQDARSFIFKQCIAWQPWRNFYVAMTGKLSLVSGIATLQDGQIQMACLKQFSCFLA